MPLEDDNCELDLFSSPLELIDAGNGHSDDVSIDEFKFAKSRSPLESCEPLTILLIVLSIEFDVVFCMGDITPDDML